MEKTMLPGLLLPETVARQDGSGSEIALENSGTPVLLTLGITRIIEQEDLDVSIWGSPDGIQWRPVAYFPQKSYCGTYSIVLDLAQYPEVRHLRAQWKMGRWSGGEMGPLFGFYVAGEELKVRRAGAN
jgi:hypothetical protein